MSNPWLLLILAGICEIGWPLGYKLAQANDGLRQMVWFGFSGVSIVLSAWLLWLAQKAIPIGTAYAVWTGIGAVGTAIAAVFLFQEPVNAMRIAGIGLIIAGIAALTMLSRLQLTGIRDRIDALLDEAARRVDRDAAADGGDAVAGHIHHVALGHEDPLDQGRPGVVTGLLQGGGRVEDDDVAGLGLGAVTDDDVNEAEARMREQDGVANSQGDLFWLVSPKAAASIKNAADFSYDSVSPQQGGLGLPLIGSINGIPVYTHNAMPGGVDSLRQQVATSAVSVSSNVATATVASGHGFVAGQQIWTAGLTTNVAVGSPATITSVGATSIVYPLTASDGALADGVGTIYSASSMAALVYRPWLWYAMDGEIPFVELVKREANAGYGLQLFQHLGRAMATGAAIIMHAPD